MVCQDPVRRSLLLTALPPGHILLANLLGPRKISPGATSDRKRVIFSFTPKGEHAGEIIKPADLTLGGPPVHAWPKDPKSLVVRNGSRLNEIVLLRLDPGELDEESRSRSADGIVAYSLICTHAGCPVSEWVKAAESDKKVLKCPCHDSEYDPRESAQVVFGPAPHHLAALPLAIAGGSLTVGAPFVGKVGGQAG